MVFPTMFEVLTFGLEMGILGVTIIALWSQIKKQSKATSADVALKMIERLRSQEFRDLWDAIKNKSITEYDRKTVSRFLNHFEYVAIFEDEGVLDLNHVIQIFGANLQAINDDKFIQKCINERVEENPSYYYQYLRKLLQKVKEYNI